MNTFKHKRTIFGALILLVFVGAIFILWQMFSGSSRGTYVPQEKVWETEVIEIAKDFSSIKLPAKVKSNQFAVLSPRRSGIIQDLLVDIGDTVYAGQTIGSMLPEGVEGQSSAAIAEASARLQKAESDLANAKGVAVDTVSVATKQLEETSLKVNTQQTLDLEAQRQLEEKKAEAALLASQAWENAKLLMFGPGVGGNSYRVQNNFYDSVGESDLESLAKVINTMEKSPEWGQPENALEHMMHVEEFLMRSENLYKNAKENRGLSKESIANGMGMIQKELRNISQIRQAILSLEEKSTRLVSVQDEKEVATEKSKESLDLVMSQQNSAVTQAEKNVDVALANYNAALVKAGHQTIKSPFSGTITARMVDVGQAVTMNQALFHLEGVNTNRSQEALFEIHFQLPESWAEKASVGDSVELMNVSGEQFPGEILRLSEQVNLQSNSIMATAIVTEKEGERPVITHGQTMFVSVSDSRSQIFSVPTVALKKRKNVYYLWKMVDEEPVQVEVNVMAEDGEYSQVFSDELRTDENIITNPSVSLFNQKNDE